MGNVEFVSPETLNNALDGYGVAVEFDDGTKAEGVWTKFVPRDGSQTMADIRKVLDPEFIIVGTDVRNFTKITVL